MKKTVLTLSLLALALSYSLASAKEEANSPKQDAGSQVQQVDVKADAEELKPLRKNPIAGRIKIILEVVSPPLTRNCGSTE